MSLFHLLIIGLIILLCGGAGFRHSHGKSIKTVGGAFLVAGALLAIISLTLIHTERSKVSETSNSAYKVESVLILKSESKEDRNVKAQVIYKDGKEIKEKRGDFEITYEGEWMAPYLDGKELHLPRNYFDTDKIEELE